jgi:hypothetical protein
LFKRKKSPRFRRHAFALPFVLIAELEDTVATTPAFVAPLGIRPKGMGPHHLAFPPENMQPDASPKIAAH